MKKSISSRIDVYQMITNVIMEKLSEGIIPWVSPGLKYQYKNIFQHSLPRDQ